MVIFHSYVSLPEGKRSRSVELETCPCHGSRYMRPATDESTGQRELSMVWIIKAWSVEKMRQIVAMEHLQTLRTVTYVAVVWCVGLQNFQSQTWLWCFGKAERGAK